MLYPARLFKQRAWQVSPTYSTFLTLWSSASNRQISLQTCRKFTVNMCLPPDAHETLLFGLRRHEDQNLFVLLPLNPQVAGGLRCEI